MNWLLNDLLPKLPLIIHYSTGASNPSHVEFYLSLITLTLISLLFVKVYVNTVLAGQCMFLSKLWLHSIVQIIWFSLAVRLFPMEGCPSIFIHTMPSDKFLEVRCIEQKLSTVNGICSFLQLNGIWEGMENHSSTYRVARDSWIY